MILAPVWAFRNVVTVSGQMRPVAGIAYCAGRVKTVVWIGMRKDSPRPRGADWIAGILAGVLLGFVLLGVGGRAGMRIIALVEGRTPAFTLEGTIAVALLGAGAGAIVGALFLLSRVLFPTRRVYRVALFWSIVGVLVYRGLRPISPVNVAIFGPLFLAHGGLLYAYWCRIRLRGATQGPGS